MTPVESTPLTQDQILAQLMVRGFEEGFQKTPLRDFWGRLSSITGDMRTGQRGSFAVALYNFDEVEVVESTEPYTNPNAQLEVAVSTRSRSQMGYLGASMDKIINAGLPDDAPATQVKNQDYLISKVLHMKLTPGHSISRKDDATGKWEDRPTDCWELLEVRGVATPTNTAVPALAGASKPSATPVVNANQRALDLLNGKTEQQWHQAVFIDPVVKADMAVIQSIINRTFLTGLETAGRIVKGENGVYKVVDTTH